METFQKVHEVKPWQDLRRVTGGNASPPAIMKKLSLSIFLIFSLVFAINVNAEMAYVCDDELDFASLYTLAASSGYYISSPIPARSYLGISITEVNIIYDPPFLAIPVDPVFAGASGQQCTLNQTLYAIYDLINSASYIHSNSVSFPSLMNAIYDYSDSGCVSDHKTGAYITTTTQAGFAPYVDLWGYDATSNRVYHAVRNATTFVTDWYANGGDCHTLKTEQQTFTLPLSEKQYLFKNQPYSLYFESSTGGLFGNKFSASDIPTFDAFGNYSGTSAIGGMFHGTKIDVKDEFETSLREKWPFSEITTALEWMELLVKSPETPKFNLRFGDLEYELVELEKFNPLAEFMRTILGVAFFLYILHSTRSLFLGVER